MGIDDVVRVGTRTGQPEPGRTTKAERYGRGSGKDFDRSVLLRINRDCAAGRLDRAILDRRFDRGIDDVLGICRADRDRAADRSTNGRRDRNGSSKRRDRRTVLGENVDRRSRHVADRTRGSVVDRGRHVRSDAVLGVHPRSARRDPSRSAAADGDRTGKDRRTDHLICGRQNAERTGNVNIRLTHGGDNGRRTGLVVIAHADVVLSNGNADRCTDTVTATYTGGQRCGQDGRLDRRSAGGADVHTASDGDRRSVDDRFGLRLHAVDRHRTGTAERDARLTTDTDAHRCGDRHGADAALGHFQLRRIGSRQFQRVTAAVAGNQQPRLARFKDR